MFGFKIIRESEYNDLKEVANRHYEAHKKERAEYEQTKKDLYSLREQNGELRKKNNRLQERIGSLNSRIDKHLTRINSLLAKLKDKADIEFEVLTEPAKCDLCKHEFKSCKKLTVGDTTVCVVPKIPFPGE